jgi:hypothetical protein
MPKQIADQEPAAPPPNAAADAIVARAGRDATEARFLAMLDVVTTPGALPRDVLADAATGAYLGAVAGKPPAR